MKNKVDEKMTSRQRVIDAIEHKKVDRFPIDLGCHYSSGISAFAYYRLREYLGLSTDNIEIIEPMQFLARVDEDILERFHCDCMHLHPGFDNMAYFNPRDDYKFIVEKELLPQQTESNEFEVNHRNGTAKMLQDGYFFNGDWIYAFDIENEKVMKKLAKEAERIYKETSYFTMYSDFCAFFMMDVEFMMKMINDKEEVQELNQRMLEKHISIIKRIIKNIGSNIQAIELNADLGTQSGPVINPQLHTELCLPYLKELCDFIHKESDYKIVMHSCGSVEPFINSFIEAGIDALNPVQVTADNMEPSVLKSKYGNRIAFWGGGCDTQNVLAQGTTEQVRKNVKELTDIFKQNSGFIFTQVHNVMGDTPSENIVAMLDEAYINSSVD